MALHDMGPVTSAELAEECELDLPIPYRPTPRAHDTRRENRLVYSSVFMVAFGLGTVFGLVLSSWP